MIEIVPIAMQASSEPIPEKYKVLWFMRRAHVMAVAPMYYRDRETGKLAVEAYYQDSDEYYWSSDTLYHFEKYNYPLPPEFLQYALTGFERVLRTQLSAMRSKKADE